VGTTLVESRSTEPGLPAVAVIPPAPERPPLQGAARATARRRASPVVVVAVVLALAAFGLLAYVLLGHIQERGGKRSPKTTLPVPSGD